jgi:Large polyvalent protein associated domain 38
MASNKNALQDALNWLGGAATNTGKAVVQAAQGFGNAFSQGKDLRTYKPTQPRNLAYTAGESFATPLSTIGNLWNDYSIFSNKNLNQLGSNPLTKAAVNAIPKVNLTGMIKDNPNSILDDIGRVGAMIPESIINSPANTFQGSQKFFEKKGRKDYSTQEMLGDLAQASDLPLTLATFGQLGSAKAATQALLKNKGAQGIIKTAVGLGKIGAREGTETGLAYGLKSGFESNRQTENPLEYAQNVGLSTVGGGIAGGLTGGILGGVSYAAGAGLNKVLSDKRAFNFFKIHKAKDVGMGWSPAALRDAIQKQKLGDTDIGRLVLAAADEAEKSGKYIKFSEEILQPDGKVRLKSRTPSRSIDLVDAPAPAGAPVDMRPNHQIALEEAARNNDSATIKYILDNMADDDPYKETMERLFRPMAEGQVEMKSVTSPIGRNPDLQAKVNPDPVTEGVDRVVFRAVDSTDGKAVLGNGTYFADDPGSVKRYGQNVQRFVLDRNAKMLDLREPSSYQEFVDDALRVFRDEYETLLEKEGGDRAFGEVLAKYAKELGYDGIRADDVAYGSVVFNKEMLRPDTSVPVGADTIDGVQKMVNDMVSETSPSRQLLDDPALLAQRLKEDPQSVLRAAEPAIPTNTPPAPPKPDPSYSENPGLDIIDKEKPPKSVFATIAEARTTMQKAYDGFVDEYDPLFRTLEKGKGDVDGMRYIFSGHYGVGSKVEGRLQTEFYPIITKAEREIGTDALREALIDYRVIEKGGQDIQILGPNVSPDEAVARAKYGLDALMNKLGPEKTAKLQTFLDDWYEFHRKGTQMAVDAGVISPEHAQNMLAKNQFYAHFDRVMDDVDDALTRDVGGIKTSSPGSISKQDLYVALKGSSRKIKDPIKTAIVDAYKLQSAIERNKVATAAIDKLSEIGQAGQLTSAENKIKRQSIFSDLAELRPVKNKVERTLKTLARIGKKIEQEKVAVAKEGINKVKNELNTENKVIDNTLNIQKGIDTITEKAVKASDAVADQTKAINRKAEAVVTSLDKLNTKLDSQNLDTLAGREGLPDMTGPITAKRAKSLMEELIEMDQFTLDRIKQRMGTLDEKTQRVIDDIDTYRTLLDQINQKRSALYDEARLARDASTRGKSVIYRLKGGIKEAWEVDPLIAESLKGMNDRQISGLVKILNPATKIFRATATGINPDFMIPNIVRDLQSAFVNFGVNPLDYVRAVSHYLKKDEMYEEWLKAGGKMSRVSIDENFLGRELDKMTTGKGLPVKSGSVPAALAKMGVTSLKDGGALILKPKDVPKALFRTLQDIGSFSEQPTRLAAFEKVYNQSLKKGVPKADALQMAAYASQEASANFARGGHYTPEFNALYAFLNARIQGLDRLARTVKKDPKGAGMRIGMITVAPALSLYAWNRAFPAYYDDRVVPPKEKEKNFIIMVSNTPLEQYGGLQYFKIPKGDVGRIANVVESFLAWGDGHQNEDGSNPFANSIGSLVEGFSPLDINFSLGPLGALSNVAVPTALKPIVEGAMNKSFFTGYDIVPEYKTALPAQYQTNSYTSPTYKWLGEKINVSPAVLQHLVEGYGTGIAKIGAKITDPAFEGMGYTAPEAKGAEINRTPIARRFAGGEHKSGEEAATSLEKQANSIEFQIRDVKSAIKRGDLDEDTGYLEMKKLQVKQQELMDRADAIRLDEEFTPSSTPTPSGSPQSDAGGLIPSAYAEANPSDIASLLKADEKKKFALDRWSMKPTEENAKRLGIDYDEATMWLLAKLPDDVESKYITSDIYKQKDGDTQDAQAMKYIEAGRLTNEKVNKSLEQGAIDGDQAAHLKALIKQYKVGKGLLKGGKAKKIKVASLKTPSVRKVPTIKLPKIKTPKIKAGSLKSGSLSSGTLKSGTKIAPPNITVSDYKPIKIKPVGRVGLR